MKSSLIIHSIKFSVEFKNGNELTAEMKNIYFNFDGKVSGVRKPDSEYEYNIATTLQSPMLPGPMAYNGKFTLKNESTKTLNSYKGILNLNDGFVNAKWNLEHSAKKTLFSLNGLVIGKTFELTVLNEEKGSGKVIDNSAKYVLLLPVKDLEFRYIRNVYFDETTLKSNHDFKLHDMLNFKKNLNWVFGQKFNVNAEFGVLGDITGTITVDANQIGDSRVLKVRRKSTYELYQRLIFL